MRFTVPRFKVDCNIVSLNIPEKLDPVLPVEKYSSFEKLCRVVQIVREFIYKLKARVMVKNGLTLPESPSPKYTRVLILRQVQRHYFSDILESFSSNFVSKDVPLINQLNLIIDSDGLIRVKCKFDKLDAPYATKFPILLPKSSIFTSSIIFSLHASLKHGGIYKILNVLRREFWVCSAYSVVKKVIKSCLFCKRLYGRPVKINQNAFKEYHINPGNIPFNKIALDHIGPFSVKNDCNQTVKVYILIITCFYSRAVNLLLCRNINSECFLNAFQLHVLEYGIPSLVVSDNGSPIVGSFPIIGEFLNCADISEFFISRNIEILRHQPYPANASFLGGIVESLVKQVKNMVNTSISRNILSYDMFYYLIRECMVLINKRPIACERSLSNTNECPFNVISPEKIIKGFDVPNLVVVPHLHCENVPRDDDIWYNDPLSLNERIINDYKKIRSVRENLINYYYDCFLQNLREMSCNKLDRYINRSHLELAVNDLVAIKQKFSKPFSFPLGLIVSTETNTLDEVVAVVGEKIRRHSSDVILLEKAPCNDSVVSETSSNPNHVPEALVTGKRAAFNQCISKNKKLFADNLAK